jgi:putative SOS response-associated peptidase YedK
MCARFSLVAPVADIENFLGAEFEADLPPRANVAPTLDVPALVSTKEGRRIKLLRWGLVPYWADDPSIGHRLINARSETAAEKPAFREAFKRRRCVIPANGFYEWEDIPAEPSLDLGLEPGPKGKTIKQPYFFHRADGQLMGMAGVWERWKQPDGQVMETCAVLTTEPNKTLARFHDRMPCILDPEDFNIWLSAEETPQSLMPLLEPLPDELITYVEADRKINNPRYEPHATSPEVC